MPTWLTAVTIPLAIALANLVALFYFRWVPNVEDQKRHLKHAGLWVMDILTLVAQGTAIYILTLPKGPVTRGFVLEAALCAGCLSFCAMLILHRRWILGDLLPRILKIIGLLNERVYEQTKVTGLQVEALCVLASDPNLSDKTIQALNLILEGLHDAVVTPQIPEAAPKKAQKALR